MAIAFVAEGTVFNNTTTDASVNVATHSEGDVLVAVGYSNQLVDISITSGSEGDWTKVTQVQASPAGSWTTAWFWKVATATEPTEYVMHITGGAQVMKAQISSFSGVDTSVPVDTTTITDNTLTNDTTPLAPAITPATTGALIGSLVASNSGIVNDTKVQPSGYTKLIGSYSTNFYLSWAYFIGGTESVPEAPGDWATFGATTDHIMMTFALRPAGAGGGTVINKVLTESTIITDPVPGTILRQRIPGERIEDMNDLLFLHTAFGRLLLDNFEVDDAYVMLKHLDRQLADTVTFSDTTQLVRRAFRDVADAVATNDGLSKTITIGTSTQTFVVVIEDVIELSDQPLPAFSGISNRILQDTIATDEFIAIVNNRLRITDGSIEFAESLFLTHKKLRADYAVVTDDMIVSRSAILNSYVALDSISLKDFSRKEITLGNLPADICIEHGIENQ